MAVRKPTAPGGRGDKGTGPEGHIVAFTGTADLQRAAPDENTWYWSRLFALTR